MKRALHLAVVFVVTAVPLMALAALVPEGGHNSEPYGPYYQLCDLLTLANNLIVYAVYLAILIAAAMFTYAGILYVTAAANEANHEKARKIFTTVAIGLVIVLASWLLINIVLSVLTGKGLNVWTNKFSECQDFAVVPNGPSTPAQPGVTGQKPTNPGSSVVQCNNCEDASKSGFGVKEGVNSGVNRETNAKLTAMCKDLGSTCSNMQITEGWPPQYAGHGTNTLHNSGRAVDIGCTYGPCSAADLNKGISAAKSAGLKPIVEVKTQADADTLVAQGVPKENVLVNLDASGTHLHVSDPPPGS